MQIVNYPDLEQKHSLTYKIHVNKTANCYQVFKELSQHVEANKWLRDTHSTNQCDGQSSAADKLSSCWGFRSSTLVDHLFRDTTHTKSPNGIHWQQKNISLSLVQLKCFKQADRLKNKNNSAVLQKRVDS